MSDHGEDLHDDPTPEDTVAGRLARAGESTPPGHPAASITGDGDSSPGETLSHGADAQPVNPDGAGDDVNR